jgi:hypothetical protein
MSNNNIFKEVLNNPKGVEEELLGPQYSYASQIKLPSEIGMSSKGSLSTLSKDITGLTEYVKALVSGGSKATRAPYLGNKFFLKTGGTCKDVDSGNSADRYVYINNVPSGNIPFISSAMGVDFAEFRGLMPGIISELNNFNPFTIMSAFMSGSNPDCQQVTLQVIDNNNKASYETNYVTLTDLSAMDACSFSDKKNPITGLKCKEGFENIDISPQGYHLNIPDKDLFISAFFICFGFILLYTILQLSYKLLKKT